MSGWPWMKGIDVPIADPIEQEEEQEAPPTPTNENGDEKPVPKAPPRPSVNALIQEHRDEIDQMKQALLTKQEENSDEAAPIATFAPETKHDDLWMLRFLLSHKKNVEKAVQAALTTLEFRMVHKLDEADIRGAPPQDRDKVSDDRKAFHRFFSPTGGIAEDSIMVVVPDKITRGTVFYFNIASLDTHQLALVDEEDWIEGMAYVNEFSFQWLDYITRTTGRLTKAVHLVDVQDLSWKMYNLQTQSKYTTATKTMQDCYPQAVQAYMVCHAPFWIQQPWKVLKNLLPQRVVSKLDFVNPNTYPEDKDRLLEFVPEEYLPARFGGPYETWPPNIPLPDL